jgi:uncharacterized protein YjiS (DUF1127 family)
MTASIAASTTVDVLNPGQLAAGLTTRSGATVREALARVKARHDYRRMLDCEDHLLRDMGVTRGDVRQAMHDCR